MLDTHLRFTIQSVHPHPPPNLPLSVRSITLESPHFIALRDQQSTNLAIFDLRHDPVQVRTHNIKTAESALMTQSVDTGASILALRAGTSLQVFNLVEMKRLGHATLTDPTGIVHWEWLDETSLGIVTDSTVWVWKPFANPQSNPTKLFARPPTFGMEIQVCGIHRDGTKEWVLLRGLTRDTTPAAESTEFDYGSSRPRLVGKALLYNVTNGSNKVLDGHAGCLTTLTENPFGGPKHQRTMLALAFTDATHAASLMLMELPTTQSTQHELLPRCLKLPLVPHEALPAFPVGCAFIPGTSLLGVVTSRGTAVLVETLSRDISSQEPHILNTVDALGGVLGEVILASIPFHRNNTIGNSPTTSHLSSFPKYGVLCVSNQGRVLEVELNAETLLAHVRYTLRDTRLSLRLSSTLNVSSGDTDELFCEAFEAALNSGRASEAAGIAKAAPSLSLRTAQTLQRFSALPTQPGSPPALSQYFRVMLEDDSHLNAEESLMLVRTALTKPSGLAYLQQLHQKAQLELSAELGREVASSDPELAAEALAAAGEHIEALKLIARGNGQATSPNNVLVYLKKHVLSNQKLSQSDIHAFWIQFLSGLIAEEPGRAVEVLRHVSRPGTAVELKPDIIDLFAPTHLKHAAALVLQSKPNTFVPIKPLQTRLLELTLMHCSAKVTNVLFPQCHDADAHVLGPKLVDQLPLRALECFVKERSNESMDGIHKSIQKLAQLDRAEDAQGMVTALRTKLATSTSGSPTGKLAEELVQLLLQYDSHVTANALVALCHAFPTILTPQVVYGSLTAKTPHATLVILSDAQATSKLSDRSEESKHFCELFVDAAIALKNSTALENFAKRFPDYSLVLSPGFGSRLYTAFPNDYGSPLLQLCRVTGDFKEFAQLSSDSRRNLIQSTPELLPDALKAMTDLGCSFDSLQDLIQIVIPLASRIPLGSLSSVLEKAGQLRLIEPLLDALSPLSTTSTSSQGQQQREIETIRMKLRIISQHSDESQRLLSRTDMAHVKLDELGRFCTRLGEDRLAFTAWSRVPGSEADVIRIALKAQLNRELTAFLLIKGSTMLWTQTLFDEDCGAHQLLPLVPDLIREASMEQQNQSKGAVSPIGSESSLTVEILTTSGKSPKVLLEPLLTALQDHPELLTQLLVSLLLNSPSIKLGFSPKQIEMLLLASAIRSTKCDDHELRRYAETLNGRWDPEKLTSLAMAQSKPRSAVLLWDVAGQKRRAMEILLTLSEQDARSYADGAEDPTVWRALGLHLFHEQEHSEQDRSNAELSDELLQILERSLKDGTEPLPSTLLRVAARTPRAANMLRQARIGLSHSSELTISYALCLAHAHRLPELTKLLAETTDKSVGLHVGQKCFSEGLLEAAQLCFAECGAVVLQASTLVRLERWGEAVAAAERARSARTWRELLVATFLTTSSKTSEDSDDESALATRSTATHALLVSQGLPSPSDTEFVTHVFVSACRARMLLDILLGSDEQVSTKDSCAFPPHLLSTLLSLSASYAPERLPKLLSAVTRDHFMSTEALATLNRLGYHRECIELLYRLHRSREALALLLVHPAAWDSAIVLRIFRNEDVHQFDGVTLLHKVLWIAHDFHPGELQALATALGPTRFHGDTLLNLRPSPSQWTPCILQALEIARRTSKRLQALAIARVTACDPVGLQRLLQSAEQQKLENPIQLAKILEAHPRRAMRRIAVTLYRSHGEPVQAATLALKDGQIVMALQILQDASPPLLSSQSSSSVSALKSELASVLFSRLIQLRHHVAIAALLAVAGPLHLDPFHVLRAVWVSGLNEEVSKPFWLESIRLKNQTQPNK